MSIIGTPYIKFVDSNKRDTGDAQYFGVNLDPPPGQTYNRVVVLNAKVPHSFYQVKNNDFGSPPASDPTNDNGGNSFTITVDVTTYEFIVPPGNYTKYGIAQTLQTLISAQIPDATVTYPVFDTTQTGKLTFSIPNPGSLVVTINFDIIGAPKFNNKPRGMSYHLRQIMGFDHGSVTLSATDPAIGTSTNVIHSRAPHTILLRSDIVETTDNILQVIDIPDQSFSDVVYTQQDVLSNSRGFLSGHNLYYFALTDIFGESLDLNGNGYQFQIMLYTSDNLNEIQLSEIKLQEKAKNEDLRSAIEENLARLEKQKEKELKKLK